MMCCTSLPRTSTGACYSLPGRASAATGGCLVIPANPRTDAQLRIRSFLSNVPSKWSTLTEEQRNA